MLAPLSHVGGYAQFLLALMIAGKIVFPRGREAEDAARLIEAEGVQSIAGAPVALVRDLVAHRRAQGGLESLAAFQLHGSALASGLVEAIRSAFPQASVGTGYGLTETNGSIAVATDDDLRRKPGCSGRVLPTVEVRIQDEAGRACEPGQAGEIWLRGAMVMRGYAGLAGAGGGLRDGWFRTGDRGRLDDDGFLFVLDRAEDVITLGTRRLSCSALARWVEGLAGVDEAAVLPLDGHGRLLLAVAPAPGRPVDLTALGAQLQTEIAAPQAQVTVVAWDRLPRTRSGKVDAAALRAVSSRLSEAVS
jgi:acyl-CoA synthetase (AMP-forming)/AMP-acid ligase II